MSLPKPSGRAGRGPSSVLRRPLLFSIVVVSIATAACSQDEAKRRHFASGEQFVQQGKLNDAIVEFRNAIERDPAWGEARLALAEAYASKGEPERAFPEYVRAADLMQENTTAQLKAARALVIVGHFEDARSRLDAVLAREPKNVEALVLRGNALAGLKDLDGAITEMTEALELDPERSETYTNLAFTRVAQGRSEDARVAFQRAVETDPQSAPTWLALANFQWSAGELGPAETSLTRALAIDPKNVLAQRAMATFLMVSGRRAEAEPHFKAVADLVAAPSADLALADYYALQKRMDDARRILEPLVSTQGFAALAGTRLASIDYSEGRIADAHRRLDQLLAKEPNQGVVHTVKARWLIAEGHYEQALEHARGAVSGTPRAGIGYYLRGVAEAATHRDVEAIKSFTEVLQLNPRAASAQIEMARLHLRQRAVDAAVPYAEEAVQNAPNRLDARLVRVRAWMLRNDLARAQMEVRDLKAAVPKAAAVHAIDGTVQLRAGNAAAARAAFERAASLDARSIEAFEGLTRLDLQEGHAAAARRRVDTWLARDADDRPVLLLAAHVFIAAGDLPEAEKMLRRHLALDPFAVETYSLLRHVLTLQRRVAEARREFTAVADREPANVAAALMAAILAHAEGDLADATRRYAGVAASEPRAVLASNNLAWLYAESGENVNRAQQLAESAVEQVPGDADLRDTLGWVYFKRGLFSQAVSQLEHSIRIDPRNANAHLHLGLALEKSGDTRRAQEMLVTALKLDPTLAEAKQALGRLQTTNQ